MSYGRVLGFVTLLVVLIAAAASADTAGITPADRAFQFHAEWAGNGRVRLGWTIAPGHYLYRDRITPTIDSRPVRRCYRCLPLAKPNQANGSATPQRTAIGKNAAPPYVA